MKSIKAASMTLALTLVGACGGGGSSSSGVTATPPPMPVIQFQPGVYSAVESLTYTAPDGRTQDGEQDFQLVATETSMRIAFFEFSATSNIDPTGFWRAPSGNFPLVVGDLVCRAEIEYSGVFQGSSVSGQSVGTINCDGIAITVNGTFSGTLDGSAGKIGQPFYSGPDFKL